MIWKFLIPLFGKIPFSWASSVASVLSFILHRILRYRVNTVRKNLEICFPEWTKHQYQETERKYYQWMGELILETLKSTSLTEAELNDHFKLVGKNPFPEDFSQGFNAVGVVGHHGNWEWLGMSIGRLSKHEHWVIYKPLSDKILDVYMRQNRERFGTKFIPIANAYQRVQNSKNKIMLGLAADQHPHRADSAIEVQFFGRRTGFFPGPGHFSTLENWKTYFGTIQRTKAFHYEWSMEELLPIRIDQQKEATQIERLTSALKIAPERAVAMIEITQAYASAVERRVKEQPETWLWSHRRFR
jgi:Kdo2-lipid IVA lauroyltransferase/acyltransferase